MEITTYAGVFDILVGGIMGFIAIKYARTNWVASLLVCGLAGLIITIGIRFLTAS